MIFFDTHAHLNMAPLNTFHPPSDFSVLIPGTDKKCWSDILKYKTYSWCYLGLGIHPWLVDQHSISDLEDLEETISIHYENIHAIGECGLDYALNFFDRERQLLFFEKQIQLAVRHGLPLILHIRKAHQDALDILRREKASMKGVVHGYSGSWEEAKLYLKLGLLLGIGRSVLSPHAKRVHEIIHLCPLEHLVVESDSPYQLSTPENIKEVIAVMAQIKGESEEKIAYQTAMNACKMLAPCK